MNELKNCPYCGGKAAIYSCTSGDDESGYYALWSACCIECGSKTDDSICSDAATEKWNTRADGWVSVGDRLPVAGAKVLILLEVGENIERGEYIGDGDFKGNWCNRRGKNYCYKVTHWMPLPSPPSAKS